MPRTKCKSNYSNSSRSNATKRNNSLLETPVKVKDDDSTKNLEDTTASTSINVPDLSKFKFEKKPHIKIQYDIESPPKEKPKGIWEPPHWKDFLTNLRIMRDNYEAPVDTMGCNMTMDLSASPEVIRYQSLIALMLSSQTKDQVTYAAMQRLRERGLTVDNVLQLSDEELGQLIYPVSFWRTKVKYIKKTTQTLKDQYNGDIPDSVDKLCKLNGVGPKMAHICMKVAWNKITGIGVDTHVHRISNRIGWVKKPTTTPEETRKALQSWVPFNNWSEVNNLMVGFGQTICLPIGPLCNECLNRDICPSSGKGRKSPKKSLKSNLKVQIDNGDDLELNKSLKSETKVNVQKEKTIGKITLETDNVTIKIKKNTKKTISATKKGKSTNQHNTENNELKIESVDSKNTCQKRKIIMNKNSKAAVSVSESEATDDDFENKNVMILENSDKKASPKKKKKISKN